MRLGHKIGAGVKKGTCPWYINKNYKKRKIKEAGRDKN